MEYAPSLKEQADAALRALCETRHVPRATYRLQFSPDFTFRDAQGIVPYLHALGISDVYASPIFKARPESTHGYDICDYGELNPVLGTREDFDALVAALHEHGMGLLLDVVPNHMGIMSVCNRWWMDVLENGPSSPYAGYFDIQWQPVKREMQNQVLLPILEDQYGVVLEDGKLVLARDGGAFTLSYYENTLPITPDTYPAILARALERLTEALDAGDAHVQELESILTALRNLPPFTALDAESVAERQREKEIVKRRIAELAEASPAVSAAIDAALGQLNGTPGDPASFDALDELVRAQPYRLAFWRVAADEINYRRFFEINDMAAVQVERPEVFEDVHRFAIELVASGQANGLRIDHPDGLWDPTAYFRQLQEAYIREHVRRRLGDEVDEAALAEAVRAAVEARVASGDVQPLYVVAEKILSETEPLPGDWAVDGTTGYDFLAAAGDLFVDPANEARFTQFYGDLTGASTNFAELAHEAKGLIMETSLSSELGAISHQLERITEESRRYRDFTLAGIQTAIQDVTASLPVYRTYISDPGGVSERDQHFILRAVVDARRRSPGTSRLLLSFLRDTLLLRNLGSFREEARARLLAFVMRWQQFTGPVMAKSVEDTIFYVYNRLVSLNEVGGHPEQFGTPPEALHEQNAQRAGRWPHAMLSTSTHDTKRSEDVRARISVLSEMPNTWEAAVRRWVGMNAGKKETVDDAPAPDRNDEYLFYQTLVGVWPDGAADADETLRARLKQYVLKAANEAKTRTSWINPDEAYSAALEGFVDRVLDDRAFVEDFLPVQRQAAYFGRFNSLSQTLLKLTSPGMPDVYQGTELWDLSLVDPDNRRRVDYEARRHALAALEAGQAERLALARDLLARCEDGHVKLYVLAAALAFRRDHAALFQQGSYEPLAAQGERAQHVFAFARRLGGQAVVVVVPRLVRGLTGGEMQPPTGVSVWGDTALAMPGGGRYRSVFTGETVDASGDLPLAEVLGKFPVALLEPVQGL